MWPQRHLAQCLSLSFSPQLSLWSTLSAGVSGWCHFQQLLYTLQLPLPDCLPWPRGSVSQAPVKWGSQELLSKHSAVLNGESGWIWMLCGAASHYLHTQIRLGRTDRGLLQPSSWAVLCLFTEILVSSCHLSCWVYVYCCRELCLRWGLQS